MTFTLAAFTVLHVLISLVGIGTGMVVAYGLITGKRFDNWVALFLATTVLTSVTGFFFPFHGFKPSYAVGILSLLLLPVAIFARYRRHLAGPWRIAFVIASMMALYLNVFVLIVQSFLKVPALHELAPTQTEAPFKLTQLAVLAAFTGLTVAAGIMFRTTTPAIAAHPELV